MDMLVELGVFLDEAIKDSAVENPQPWIKIFFGKEL